VTKYTLIKTNSGDLTDLKQQYLQQLATPLDGMWEVFATLADHYSIVCEDKIIGYCVINSDHKLLQFYVPGPHDSNQIFSQIIVELRVAGAFTNTGEFQYLSMCMDHHKSVVVNAIMYGFEKEGKVKNVTFPRQSKFRIIEANELEYAVEFGINTLGADPDWLKGYFAELIKQKQLFGLWQANSLIATGECRESKTQKPYADLGMVVSADHRKQGLATSILQHLLCLCREQGLRAICSTERDNIAAQKAITKAGFISQHRILEIIF